MAAVGRAFLRVELPRGLVLGPPREHRLREHVVEDLVADAAALLERAQDPALARAWRARAAARRPGPAPKSARSATSCAIFVPDGVTRWLKSRAATSFCVRRQLRHRALEMLLDDVLRTAETLERLGPQHVGARGALLVPEPLHDELEVRRLDPRAPSSAPSTAPSPPSAGSICPAPTSSSTRSTSSGSTATRLAGELGVALDRADDRGAGAAARSSRSSRSVFAKRPGNAAREAIELGERVLAQRDEDVDPRAGAASTRGQRLGERPGPAVVGVVEEVLLGLVEDEVDVAARLRVLERVERRAVDRVPARLAHRLGERGAGSSLQREKTTTSGSSGSSRSERATAARRSDDLPTPLGP